MPAPDVKSEENLEIWLTTQSREAAVAIAARVALRGIPFFRGFAKWRFLQGQTAAMNTLLVTLRAMASPLVAAKYSPKGPMFRAAAVHSAEFDFISAAAIRATAASARSAARSVFAAAPQRVAAATARSAAYADSAAVWESIQWDCDRISEGNSASALCSMPLWGKMRPDWVQKRWNTLRAELEALGQNWEVWTRWYGAILDGRPTPGGEELDIFRVLLNGEDDWKKGATRVNALIKVKEDEIEGRDARIGDDTVEARGIVGQLSVDVLGKAVSTSPDPQNTIAPSFSSEGDGPVDLDAKVGGNDVANTHDNRDGYAECKRLINELLALRDTEGASPNNNNSTAYGRSELLLDSMGESLRDLRPAMFIPRGEALRQLLAEQLNHNSLADTPPCSEKVTAQLKLWQAAHNVFVELDAELARRDAAILGPDRRRVLVPPSEAREVASSAEAAGAITSAAKGAVVENAGVAPEVPDGDNRNSRRASETAKNLARGLTRKLQQFAKFIIANPLKTAAPPVALYKAAEWALRNADWLLKTFADNPTMLSILKPLLEFLKTLPF